MEDILNASTQLAVELRHALNRWRSATEEWIEATLALASKLLEARNQHPSNKAFGVWLAQEELLDLSDDDRAALIGMAQHLSLSRSVLKETDRRSVRLIWLESIKPQIDLSSQCCEDNTQLSKAPELSTSPDKHENSTSGNEKKPEAPKVEVSTRSPLAGFKRADEVSAIYTNKYTRASIAKIVKERGGNDLWKLILEALDMGLLQPTDIKLANHLSLKLLFPETSQSYAQRFNLAHAKDRQLVRTSVLPAVLACREAIEQNQEQLGQIVDEYWQRESARKEAERAAQQIQQKIKALPSNQQEVIMFGFRLWPKTDKQFYGYDDLRYGIWWFNDLNRWIDTTADPASRGQMMRHVIGRIHTFSKHCLPVECRAPLEHMFGIVRELSRLMVQNPKGECSYPHAPMSEDEK